MMSDPFAPFLKQFGVVILDGALAKQAITEPELLTVAVNAVVGEGREQAQTGLLLSLHLVDHTLVRVDQPSDISRD